jgi:chromosome segregation ATPase
VPVSVIRRDQDDAPGTNKLDTTRQALREQIEAREHSEHLLQDAQATIHDLQTKMAHERLARDEAILRAESEKQLVEQALQRADDELAIERDRRKKAEQERDDAIAGRQKAEGRIQEMLATLDALKASQAVPRSSRDRADPDAETDTEASGTGRACETVPQTTRRPGEKMPASEPSAGGDEVKQVRRRGRPAKSDQSASELVEWWKSGWRDRFR